MTSDSKTLPPGGYWLIDMTLSGWLQKDSGHLLEGFPINANDKVLILAVEVGLYSVCRTAGAEIYVADLSEENVQTTVERLKQTGARAVHPR